MNKAANKNASEIVLYPPMSERSHKKAFAETINVSADVSDKVRLTVFSFFSLNLVKKGEGKHIFSGKERCFSQNGIFLQTPYTPYALTEGSAEILRIYFRPELLPSVIFSPVIFSKNYH